MTTTSDSIITRDKTNSASLLALAALALIALLAFAGVTQPNLADRATLLFLAICGALCCWTPLRRTLEQRVDAATFVLLAAFFVIYTLARNAGPGEGWSLHSHFLPDEPLGVSWAARVAVGGAVLSLLARPRLAGITRAILAALLIVGATGIVMFTFLGHYFAVGVTGQAEVNPQLLFYPLQQVIEFGALAILCNAVAADSTTRKIALRALPLFLFALWARHQFGPVYVEPDE